MAITVVSDLSTIQTAFEQRAYFALRPELHFDAVATVRASDLGPRAGSAVTFTIWQDMAAQTTALTENADVTAVTLGDDQVTVTLVEQGAAAGVTRKLVGTSYLDVLSDVANIVGYNAGISLDTLAATALYAGTNVEFVGQASQAAITASDELTAHIIRQEVAALRAANVMPLEGGLYAGFMHPDVAVDIMEETGGAGWHEPANYSDANRRWNGQVGVFEGVRWMVTPRPAPLTDAGATTVDVYQTLIVGRDALAKAVASRVSGETPEFIVSPVVDKLRRFFHFGWYWLGGYDTFREAAVRRIESSSSIGAN
jgi:N4-gp56 family major capsid protein